MLGAHLASLRDAEADSPEACLTRAWIQDLYRVDARAATVDERGRLRRTEVAAVLEKMKTWMSSRRVVVTTSLGAAIRHALASWPRLTVFVNQPLVWLDNNRTERGLRGPVIGVDPIAYLVEVATRARQKGGGLMPDEYKRTNEWEATWGSARNRRKRERQLRKRHEQREYRRLTRAIEVAPKILRRPPPGVAKMSDTLVAFAQPLLDAIPPGAPIEAYQGELLLGATVWNFLVTLDRECDRQGDAVEILEEQMRKILDALSLGTGLSEDDALDLLQTLAGRKHDLFADERRLIGDVHAEFRGDRVHVVALSTLPL